MSVRSLPVARDLVHRDQLRSAVGAHASVAELTAGRRQRHGGRVLLGQVLEHHAGRRRCRRRARRRRLQVGSFSSASVVATGSSLAPVAPLMRRTFLPLVRRRRAGPWRRSGSPWTSRSTSVPPGGSVCERRAGGRVVELLGDDRDHAEVGELLGVGRRSALADRRDDDVRGRAATGAAAPASAGPGRAGLAALSLSLAVSCLVAPRRLGVGEEEVDRPCRP